MFYIDWHVQSLTEVSDSSATAEWSSDSYISSDFASDFIRYSHAVTQIFSENKYVLAASADSVEFISWWFSWL